MQLIGSNVLASPAASVTFSSIPGTFADLVLVITGTLTTMDSTVEVDLNGDTSSNYNWVQIAGDGSASSSRQSNSNLSNHGRLANPDIGVIISHFFDYATTNKHKTWLTRSNSSNANAGVRTIAGRWANTSAVTSVTASCGINFAAGSSFHLYGISA